MNKLSEWFVKAMDDIDKWLGIGYHCKDCKKKIDSPVYCKHCGGHGKS